MPRASDAVRTLTAILLAIGLAGHVYAARAIGGSSMAYQHHVGGFVLILAVSGGLLWALARFVWPNYRSATLLAIGVVQAAIGLFIALAPASVLG